LYALHKFIIFKRRRNKEKQERDKESALRVFNELIKNNKQDDIKRIFSSINKKWQKTVVSNLREAGENEMAVILEDFICRKR